MKIFFADHFKSQLKRLMKKYPSAKEDLLEALEEGDLQKSVLDKGISIGRSIYKLRVGSRDMKRGKSGSFRVYIYCFVRRGLLVPLCIYAKPDTSAISENELQFHFERIVIELAKIKAADKFK